MNFIKPEMTVGRLNFFFLILSVMVMVYSIVWMYDEFYLFDTNESFAVSFLIPMYLLYFAMHTRFNDIGKLHILMYIYMGLLLLSWVIIGFDINLGGGVLVDVDEMEFAVLSMIFINFTFGWLLILYGFIKSGQGITTPVDIYLEDNIRQVHPKHLKEVKKSHKPDFTQYGLVMFFQGKQRPILSDIDYDMIQPGELKGVRMFEFRLQDVS